MAQERPCMWVCICGCLLIVSHSANGYLWQGPVDVGSFIYQKGAKLCYVTETDVTSSTIKNLGDLCIAYNLKGRSTLAVRTYGKSLFLGDSGNSELERRYLKENRQHIVSYGSHHVGGVSVDWSSNTVYWSESYDGTILAAYTEGFYQYVTAIHEDLDFPRGVAVDPQHRYLYWSQGGKSNTIMRSIPDGSRKTIFLSSGVGTPGDLAVDLGIDGQRLYWVDLSDNSIKSVDLQGDNITTVVKASPGVSITGLTVSKFLLAWAQSGSGGTPGLYWSNKTDGTVIRVKPQTAMTYDIVYYGEYPRHDPAKGLCSKANGGCAHICLHVSQNKVCRCSFGYHTTDGGKTCTAAPSLESSFLLVTDLGWWDLYMVSLDPTTGHKVTKLLGNENYPISVQYDRTSTLVYWINKKLNTIMRGYMNGTHKELIYTIPTGINPDVDGTNTNPQSMALDAERGRLYVTDSGRDVIFSVSTDGTQYRNITYTGLDRPRDLLLDTANSYVYWTDWGVEPKIERSGLSGANRKTLVHGRMSAPTGITADFEASYLYWVDASLNRVERCHLGDGSGRIVLAEIPNSHLYDIALYGGYLYATDRQNRHLKRIPVGNGKFEEWGPGLFQVPFQIKVVNIAPKPEPSTKPPAENINLPLIIGASVGALVLVIIVLVIVVICVRKKRQKLNEPETGFENPSFNHGAQSPASQAGTVSSTKSTSNNNMYGRQWDATSGTAATGSVASRNTDVSALTYDVRDDASKAGTVSSRMSDNSVVSYSSNRVLFHKK